MWGAPTPPPEIRGMEQTGLSRQWLADSGRAVGRRQGRAGHGGFCLGGLVSVLRAAWTQLLWRSAPGYVPKWHFFCGVQALQIKPLVRASWEGALKHQVSADLVS